MDKVLSNGLMEPSMKVTGRTTRQTVKESFGTLMVTFSKVSGRTTRQMVMGFTDTQMELCTKDTG